MIFEGELIIELHAKDVKVETSAKGNARQDLVLDLHDIY